MIKRILDVDAIESEKINLAMKTENLAEITKEVAANFQMMAKNKSIQLNVIDKSENPISIIDKNCLIQVLENIISNAIKYTFKNTNITIVINEFAEQVEISVTDQGPGISEEDQSKMFGHFQKLSAKPTGGEESYGLGLSIVKKYVEAMKGTIQCKSKLQEGTTFLVTFDKIRQ